MAQAVHVTSVGVTANNHGYPWKAVCSCGWASRGYVAAHAAQAMADDHDEQVVIAALADEASAGVGDGRYLVGVQDENSNTLVEAASEDDLDLAQELMGDLLGDADIVPVGTASAAEAAALVDADGQIVNALWVRHTDSTIRSLVVIIDRQVS